MGFIYKITCTKTGMVYIGQTTNTVDHRWKQHWADSRTRERKLARGETYQCCSKLYAAFAEYGKKAFIVEQMLEVDDAELNAAEKRLITEYDAIILGYNIQGGSDKVPAPDAKERRHARIAERREGNPNYDASLYDLPTYCMYLTKRDTEGLAISNHPLCNHKEFMVCTYGTMEAAKEALLAYLVELTTAGVKQPGLVKREPDLPKGVRKIEKVEKCYFVDKTLNGNTFRKAFSDKSDDENRTDAIAYLRLIETTPGMVPEPTKADADLPRGITRRDNVFLVAKTIKGVAYRQRFKTVEEATVYLNTITASPPPQPLGEFVKKDSDLPRGITKVSRKYVVCKTIKKVMYKQSFDNEQLAINYLESLEREHANTNGQIAQNILL